MKLVNMICEELGVKINEEWKGNDGCNYKINKQGQLMQIIYLDNLEEDVFERLDSIEKVLTGELKPIWKPKVGETYYVPELCYDKLYDTWTWNNYTFCNRLLKRGLVFKTKEEAESLAQEMIALAKHGI